MRGINYEKSKIHYKDCLKDYKEDEEESEEKEMEDED